jgi:hypothetical protein
MLIKKILRRIVFERELRIVDLYLLYKKINILFCII